MHDRENVRFETEPNLATDKETDNMGIEKQKAELKWIEYQNNNLVA